MTGTTAAHFLATGRKYEGTREGADNRNPFTEWLHKHGYRKVNGEFWCADYEAFLDYITGNVVPSHSAATYVQADAYRKAHRWSDQPHIGAKVFFYEKAMGRIAHMGHVVAYTASTVTVQSGNTSAYGGRNGDRVATKVYPRHHSSGSSFYIAGYGLPAFKAAKGKPGNINRTLRHGSAGNDVARVQRLVGTHADGIYGPKTEAAVKAWQKRHHLTADGQFGPKSAKAAGWTYNGKRVR